MLAQKPAVSRENVGGLEALEIPFLLLLRQRGSGLTLLRRSTGIITMTCSTKRLDQCMTPLKSLFGTGAPSLDGFDLIIFTYQSVPCLVAVNWTFSIAVRSHLLPCNTWMWRHNSSFALPHLLFQPCHRRLR